MRCEYCDCGISVRDRYCTHCNAPNPNYSDEPEVKIVERVVYKTEPVTPVRPTVTPPPVKKQEPEAPAYRMNMGRFILVSMLIFVPIGVPLVSENVVGFVALMFIGVPIFFVIYRAIAESLYYSGLSPKPAEEPADIEERKSKIKSVVIASLVVLAMILVGIFTA